MNNVVAIVSGFVVIVALLYARLVRSMIKATYQSMRNDEQKYRFEVDRLKIMSEYPEDDWKLIRIDISRLFREPISLETKDEVLQALRVSLVHYEELLASVRGLLLSRKFCMAILWNHLFTSFKLIRYLFKKGDNHE